MEIKFQDYMIRSWKDEDAPVISKYANNRKIWLNLRDGFPHPYTLEDAKNFIINANIGLSLGSDVHRYYHFKI